MPKNDRKGVLLREDEVKEGGQKKQESSRKGANAARNLGVKGTSILHPDSFLSFLSPYILSIP